LRISAKKKKLARQTVLEKLKIKWVYAICAIFIVLNCIFIVNEFYWFAIIPVLLLIVMLFIFSMDILLLMIVFLTPLSVNLSDFDLNIGVYLPTEPLLFGVMLIFLFNVAFRNRHETRLMKHPVTIAIIIYLIWMFITSITSTMPVVSFKFLVSKLWFIIPFFFLGTHLFKNIKNMRRFVWLYIISFTLVIAYTIYNHSTYGFDEQTAHWVMSPFYNDHTSYGALLSMFIPIVLAFCFDRSYNRTKRIISFVILAIFILAVILSYSRAAWISLAVAFIIFLIMKLRIDYRIVIAGIIILTGVYFMYSFEIFMKLEKNRQDSSKDYVEHIQSISNISTDASNLERINRWQCAFRMFNEKPVFGWGPGTYQFKYAPFQHSQEKTIISTNAGDMGNAHSEYIGPLAEEGFIGTLSILAIVILSVNTAVRTYKRSVSKEVRFITLTILVSLFTYFVHGLLNNFLDTDKASVPFWGMIAMLVALDIYHRDPDPLPEQESEKEKK
jgi:putative inorganic carbon (hco3(-)) transporter